MGAVKRMVSTNFWLDSKVVDEFTPEDKYFFLYLLTNPHTTQLGIYELNQKQAAFELGYSVETVGALLERFEKKYGIITYNKPTKEVVIKNYLIHSIIKGGKPVEDCLAKEISQVKDQNLISILFESLISKEDIINETVRIVINKYLNKTKNNEEENDNDNDNENERFVPRVVNESPFITLPAIRNDFLVTTEYLEELKETYPAVDVEQELREMKMWLDSNPANKKVNTKSFITRWLGKEQDKGRVKPTQTTPNKDGVTEEEWRAIFK